MTRIARFRSSIHAAVALPFAVVVLAIYVFLAASPSVPGRGITSMGGMLFSAVTFAGIVFLLRIAAARVDVYESGVKVASIFTTRFVTWQEIDRFEYGSFKWWSLMPNCVSVHLRDGRQLQATGVQGGKPAQQLKEPTYETKAVDELNELLSVYRGRGTSDRSK